LTEKAPQMSQQIASGQIITDVLQKRGWEAGPVRQVEGAVRAHAGQILGYVQGAVAATLSWLAGAWVIVLVPVFAFFILKDAEPAAVGIDALIEEPRHRERRCFSSRECRIPSGWPRSRESSSSFPSSAR
jgi:predicted PurR-regulated permease PerM